MSDLELEVAVKYMREQVAEAKMLSAYLPDDPHAQTMLVYWSSELVRLEQLLQDSYAEEFAFAW
jgi:hypothetical protein